jgi:hypothetical protein
MKSRTVLSTLLMVLMIQSSIVAQNNGDYRTRSGGKWSDKRNWEILYNGRWCKARTAPEKLPYNTLTIREGHSILFDLDLVRVKNLEVEQGANLLRNSPVSGCILHVTGNILCNGIIGNGSTHDKILLLLEGDRTEISGAGECKVFAIVKGPENEVTDLVINMDVEVYNDEGASLFILENNALLHLEINPDVTVMAHAPVELNSRHQESFENLVISSSNDVDDQIGRRRAQSDNSDVLLAEELRQMIVGN